MASLISTELAVLQPRGRGSVAGQRNDRVGFVGGGMAGAADGAGQISEINTPLRLLASAAVRLALNQVKPRMRVCARARARVCVCVCVHARARVHA